MNYIGSKLSLLNFITDSIRKVASESANTFADVFSGTGAVGVFFKQLGFSVIANDVQFYSYVLNRHYIGNHRELKFSGLRKLIDFNAVNVAARRELVCKYLMQLSGKSGFIYQNYADGGTRQQEFPRLYFSDENAQKCDAIREQIQLWQQAKMITEDEYFFLLTSLLEAIDKRANTASVYGAFLKKLKKSALKPLELLPAKLFCNDQEHRIYNKNANDLIREISADILYLDPPYNERQYCANYHLLETIARNDQPKIFGKTGLRDYQKQKSKYCAKNLAQREMADLVTNANAKYIFLSYNNEGLLTLDEIKDILSTRGKYGCFTHAYNRFKADNKREYIADTTTEYLHYCICKNGK